MTRVTLGQIGSLLRERRGERGVRETAKEIGVSAATLSRIENGKQPDLATFPKICGWLKLDPAEVLGMDTATSKGAGSPLDQVATAHFRASRELDPTLARALGELILRTQAMFGDEPDVESAIGITQ